MRVLVCGGRDYANRERLYNELDEMHHDPACGVRERGAVTLIIHGDASGADRLAAAWATENRVPVQAWPADWALHGLYAGPFRNAKMLAEGKPDLVVAFPGGRGTADMVRRARRAGVDVVEVSAEPAEAPRP
jgi:hypothetical protein